MQHIVGAAPKSIRFVTTEAAYREAEEPVMLWVTTA